MYWLLLVVALGGFAVGLLSSSAWLLSTCMLLSLLCALAWCRGLYDHRLGGSHNHALIDPDELKRLGQ